MPNDETIHIGYCDVNWGSHACRFKHGHEGSCECNCYTCEGEHTDTNGCVAKPPYYGPDTKFYGADVVSRGLPQLRSNA